MKGSRIGEIVRESLTIGGWVSMWRPLEIFLYDWWRVRREARLSDRLAAKAACNANSKSSKLTKAKAMTPASETEE
jgi:hypothetical protein